MPTLGAGIGYRPELREHQSKHADRIDWFELIADRYVRSVPESIERALPLLERHPLIPHALETSLGTDGPLDVEYCEEVAELVKLVRAPFSSDHLCMTKAGGVELGQLTPLPFTEAAVRRCAKKARQVQEILGVPFLIENITYAFAFPSPLGEAEFVTRVLTEADCGLLLDLANVFINSQNHRYDPYALLDALPLERVIQVHLAGGERRGAQWIDSHSQRVDSNPEVWQLLEYVARRSEIRAVLIERDQNFPEEFQEMLQDLDRARDIMHRAHHRPPRPPAPALPSASAEPVPLPMDELKFQTALARLLVEPALRKRFLATPQAVGAELSLGEEQTAALLAVGAEHLSSFAHDLASKRLSLLAKAAPASCKWLQNRGLWHELAHRFVDDHAPLFSPEFVNRSVRDGFWFLRMLDQVLVERPELLTPLGDIVRFERAQLELSSTVAPVQSAKDFRQAYEATPAPGTEALLAARPRTGPHVRVERFGCDVVELVRRINAGQDPQEVPGTATAVLFTKAPGFRNVRHLAINERTRSLLALCDGTRTTVEIAAQLSRSAGSGKPQEALACAEVIRRLHELNALTLTVAS
ncbi:DUF692 family protein [Stigmatella sp. ncwal1]|uniref:DUF692 family protein n=1 Tax=Stigmatella ashevillensis TaxID=2995309 RepID=A0ABT5D1U6_9BACT|nr:DUF692 family multinuclear iron-containing protein [Stigmatella ashevillena]MDC0707556.1 DUF692 family protein [Stigmatella ashevillena]